MFLLYLCPNFAHWDKPYHMIMSNAFKSTIAVALVKEDHAFWSSFNILLSLIIPWLGSSVSASLYPFVKVQSKYLRIAMRFLQAPSFLQHALRFSDENDTLKKSLGYSPVKMQTSTFLPIMYKCPFLCYEDKLFLLQRKIGDTNCSILWSRSLLFLWKF